AHDMRDAAQSRGQPSRQNARARLIDGVNQTFQRINLTRGGLAPRFRAPRRTQRARKEFPIVEARKREEPRCRLRKPLIRVCPTSGPRRPKRCLMASSMKEKNDGEDRMCALRRPR